MKKFFVMLILVGFLPTFPMVAKHGKPPQEGDKTPVMVAYGDLKWTKLPEREGAMFAVSSGDPTKGTCTQMRKLPAGTDNGLTCTAVS